MNKHKYVDMDEVLSALNVSSCVETEVAPMPIMASAASEFELEAQLASQLVQEWHVARSGSVMVWISQETFQEMIVQGAHLREHADIMKDWRDR